MACKFHSLSSYYIDIIIPCTTRIIPKGKFDKGGFIIDFMFTNPPDLGVNVQGVYYHYQKYPNGVETKARDVLARASMAGQNITLVFIDDDDLLRNPRFYCREALNYKDHSRLGGG